MSLDPGVLARIQFAFTVSFHIIFPTMSIGLAGFLAIVEGLWLKTKDEVYLQVYRFWLSIFAMGFGIGVVTGIVLSFEFGQGRQVAGVDRHNQPSGPHPLESALLDQLKNRRGVILYNTSVLAFVPLAVTAVYSATKAALHSYVLSQRFLLHDSGVRVFEVALPWVRTELMNSQEAEQAMPLDRFITETLDVLGTDADEILVEAAKPLRANPGPSEHALVNGFNQQTLKPFTSGQA